MQIHTNTCLYSFQPISVWRGFRYRHCLRYRHIHANTCIYVLIQTRMNSPKHACAYKYYIYIFIQIHAYIISSFTYNMQWHRKKCLYLACIMQVYCIYSCIYVHMGVHIYAYVLICAHTGRLRDLAAKNVHTYEQYEHI